MEEDEENTRVVERTEHQPVKEPFVVGMGMGLLGALLEGRTRRVL